MVGAPAPVQADRSEQRRHLPGGLDLDITEEHWDAVLTIMPSCFASRPCSDDDRPEVGAS
jgi:hypothetical protein